MAGLDPLVVKSILEKKINLALAGLASASVSGATINFTFMDGTQDSITFQQPADGEDGVSIVDVEIDASNHLIVTLSDESTIDAGALPDGGTWGNITGNLSDQTDLKNALDAKADSSALSELDAELKAYVDEAIGGALSESY